MKPILTLALFAALAGIGSAATISYSDTTPVVEGGTLDGSNQLQVSKFDTSLGTLTKVEVTITLSMPSFTLDVDNDADTAANVKVTFGTIGGTSFSSSANTLNTSLNQLTGTDFGVASQLSTFDVQATSGDAIGTFENDGGSDNGSFITSSVLVGQIAPREISSAVWGEYQSATPGTISYDLAVDWVTDLNVNSGGGSGLVLWQGSIPAATFSSTVTYTYTAVPEPASALLGGIGFLFLLRRRRR